MKPLLAVCLSACSCIAISTAISAVESASSEPQAAAHGSVHGEIERLRHEFDRQRARVLHPVAGRYLAQLETLQKSIVEQDRAAEAEVASALKAAREVYWQEDQPELKRAVLGRAWIWRSEKDGIGVITVFHGDGTVEHVNLRGTWQVTGPSEVTIATDGDGNYVLRFDASLQTYKGDRDSISGTALPSATETLCANIWSLRGDKLEFRRDGSLIQRGEGWVGKDWRLSDDETQVTIRFTNGNGGTFKFENGAMTHFDGSPFQRTPRD